MDYLTSDNLTRENIRYLAEKYAPVYGIFRALVNEEAEKLFSTDSNISSFTLSIMHAKSLLSRLEKFEHEVPRTLVAIVHDNFEMMRRVALTTLYPGNPSHMEQSSVYKVDPSLRSIRRLVESYAELCFVYDKLLCVRDDDRNGPVERNLAIELRSALRDFVANVPRNLRRIVRDKHKEMINKASKVLSRTADVPNWLLASGLTDK